MDVTSWQTMTLFFPPIYDLEVDEIYLYVDRRLPGLRYFYYGTLPPPSTPSSKQFTVRSSIVSSIRYDDSIQLTWWWWWWWLWLNEAQMLTAINHAQICFSLSRLRLLPLKRGFNSCVITRQKRKKDGAKIEGEKSKSSFPLLKIFWKFSFVFKWNILFNSARSISILLWLLEQKTQRNIVHEMW